MRAVQDDLASGGELVRAWSVPALRGNVHLIHKPEGWCISVPDPLTDQPNLERGKTCSDTTTFERVGISIGIGDSWISVGPAVDAPLVVTLASSGPSARQEPSMTSTPAP